MHKMKLLYLVIAIFFISRGVNCVFAQDPAPEQEWVKLLTGLNGSTQANSIQQTSDGGYIIAGSFTPMVFPVGDAYDAYVAKIDAQGNVVWEGTFGGNRNDMINSIQQTSDGGYIYVGLSESFGAGDYDAYLVKLDAQGNVEWGKTFGGKEYDCGYAVKQTADGGYIIVGTTESFHTTGWGLRDVYLFKTDANGNVIWGRSFDETLEEEGTDVQQTADGGYIIASGTYSFGPTSHNLILLTKTDAGGNSIWEKRFPIGSSSLRAAKPAVQQTKDGGYIVSGEITNVLSHSFDAYLFKTDSGGAKEWEKTFGGDGHDFFSSVQQTKDGGYILAGKTNSWGAGSYDASIIKTDDKGNVVWGNTYGGSKDDWASSIQQTADGGYVFTGTSQSWANGGTDAFVIKLKAESPVQKFIRGEVDGNGQLDIADPIKILNYLFSSGTSPSCLKTADVNDDGHVDIADAIYALNFLFSKGPAPKDPYPACGIDPTPDALTCLSCQDCK